MAGELKRSSKTDRNGLPKINEITNSGRNKWAGRKRFYRKKPPVFVETSKTASSNKYKSSTANNIQSLPGHSLLHNSWNLYFPDEDFSECNENVRKIEILQNYFRDWKQKINKEEIEANECFWIDVKELFNNEEIRNKWPTLKEELEEFPEKTLLCFGVAMHHLLLQDMQTELNSMIAESVLEGEEPNTQIVADSKLPRIFARVKNYEPLTALKNLKANYYGRLVSIKGTVVRVSNLKPLCVQMAFRCTTCNSIQNACKIPFASFHKSTSLPDGKYISPMRCLGDECRGKSFLPERCSRVTETVDWQTIRIQEIVTDDQRETGRIPRTIECELTNDLVDSCIPGDVVILTGIVKILNSSEGINRSNKDASMFTLYLHANSIINCKGKGGVKADNQKNLAEDFTLQDLYDIKKLHTKENLFQLLVASLCPAIYGHEMVKAGLILGLFGGTQKHSNDKNCIPVRGDPHVLVVGDPGLGKSQMLQTCSTVAPRGVYVCGNTTTTSGLTVTVCKENSGADYVLEAGALVLADQGCCCIDEFDKMPSQHQALLEAMEQQCISIAKAGIICSLPARTSILAAANPTGGHYNRAKTVAENLKMGSALLSRFDLVFILLDKPDEHMDNLMSHHVMALHSGLKPISESVLRSESQSSFQIQESQSLGERLKACNNLAEDLIPHSVFRKYISYARKYVNPQISPEGAECLQSFYLELRRKSQRGNIPITTRQLESMIRLTEARARVELREVASLQDAKDVIDIMKHSMIDTFLNENGLLDFRRSQHGSGMSYRSQAKRFIEGLDKVALQTSNCLFSVQQMHQIAKDIGIQVRSFEDFLQSLNDQNYLLKKGPRLYQLLTTNF